MSATATQVLLRQRPIGLPTDDTWEIANKSLPPLRDGEFLVRLDYISLDPAMRGWLKDAASYIPPVGIGEVMRAQGVGTVTESRNQEFAAGDTVTGRFGVTDYAVSDGTDVLRADLSIAPAPTWLGALGMPGMTAYFGLHEIGKFSDGETVVVSGAAGAVGSVVGQLAKARGANVVGIAGGPAKCAWLTDTLGFDAAIDYKTEPVLPRLRNTAPEGIDVFFDNVGGQILDDALANLRRNARIVLCGAISGYNDEQPAPGPSRYMSLLVNRGTMTGFLVFDFKDRYHEAIEAISSMIVKGELVPRETIAEGGIPGFGAALRMLFEGANTGKLVLRV